MSIKDSSLRIIVTGLIAQYPLGGMTWHYLQYLLGFMRLGHDIYYLEDTGQWPYNPQKNSVSKDCKFNVRYLHELMTRFELADKWAYCFPDEKQWFGLSGTKLEEIKRTADLLINVSGTLRNPWEYAKIDQRVFIDTDPVFTQLKLLHGQKALQKMVDAHHIYFSFGETLPGSVPLTGHNWLPTRQPIVLSEWDPETNYRNAFTTVMNWTSYTPIEYGDKTYGQKDIEFQRFMDLPGKVKSTILELAINEHKKKRIPRSLLEHKGWILVDPEVVCPNLDSYRDYIQSSKAEWGVAKNGYVQGKVGWFSERSACYLASGRPVVVQDTGFSSVLPTEKGILPFKDLKEAEDAIIEVERNYKSHSIAARSIAEEYFDSEAVLTHLINRL